MPAATHQALKRAFKEDKIRLYGTPEYLNDPHRFRSFLRPLFRKHWIVYCNPQFGGPQHVLQYLARYSHRVAISNHRLVRLADGPGDVPLPARVSEIRVNIVPRASNAVCLFGPCLGTFRLKAAETRHLDRYSFLLYPVHYSGCESVHLSQYRSKLLV